ncbi:SNF2 family N-terminal domain-containing protein [Chytriomyces sp. MP71]|nr:SNF2 family N-terminal domain-containing protein [Chytriomyces sp. MP71]
MEAQMFEFFGTVVRRELIDTLMCTEEQADCILEFRPFESITDLYEKFGRVKKGKQKVSKLMEKYHSLMDGYSQVDQLINTCERKGDELMSVMNGWISRGAIPLIDDGVDDAVAVSNPNHCLKTQPQILNPKMKLKSYQLVGVSWLNLLYSKSLGGILADEMGLGKTAQVIAFISLLKEQRQVGTPHLIVVPSSTLENWLREFQNWSPSLNVLSYYGSQSERQEIRYHVAEKDLADYDAVVTTYNLSSSKEDRVFLKKLRPRSLILDEGHMVKNMESSRYKNLNSINAPFRLLLTGTPLQNNLMELLSLLTFIMPRVFAQDEEALKQIFNLKSTTSSDATVLNRQRIQRAKKMMTPFVLRRKKDDVLTELPAKSHQEVMCTMTPTQDALYQQIIQCPLLCLETKLLIPSSKKVGGTPKKAKLPLLPGSGTENINVLMQLRKAANHPLLFRRLFTDVKIKVMAREIMKEEQYMEANMQYIFEDMQVMSDFELHKLCMNFKSIKKHALNADQWMDSGKVQSLSKLLPAMLEKGDRVLIFSQFVIMLDVLESVMKTLGIRYLRLDGQTNVVDRQSLIDQYNEDDTIGVFLLSTKAGGLGLNLTSANVVIIHDMDFNPHNDAQAEDRAHRVGQTREVTVLKLVVSGSVEQHILRLATTKLKLDKSLQQRGVSLEEDGDDVEGGNSSNGRTSSKSTDFVENEVDATLATVDDDKKLMEMLRSEWRVSGETL